MREHVATEVFESTRILPVAVPAAAGTKCSTDEAQLVKRHAALKRIGYRMCLAFMVLDEFTERFSAERVAR